MGTDRGPDHGLHLVRGHHRDPDGLFKASQGNESGGPGLWSRTVPGHKIQGLKNLKESYVPGIFDRSRIDALINVDDEDAFETARRLAREEGLFVGMSSGAAMFVALEKARELSEGLIVVILPDGGDRYLTTTLFVCQEKTPIKFFNHLTRRVEDFVPLKSGEAGIYSCGPALYSTKQVATYRHIVVADLYKKTPAPARPQDPPRA
jgi:cysteinyl-tRNA synthetase